MSFTFKVPNNTYDVQVYTSGFSPLITGIKTFNSSTNNYTAAWSSILTPSLADRILMTKEGWVAARLTVTGIISGSIYNGTV